LIAGSKNQPEKAAYGRANSKDLMHKIPCHTYKSKNAIINEMCRVQFMPGTLLFGFTKVVLPIFYE